MCTRRLDSTGPTHTVGTIAMHTRRDDNPAACCPLTGSEPPFPAQMSALAVNFVRQCLAKDPRRRPKMDDLLYHSWIVSHCPEADLRRNHPLAEDEELSYPRRSRRATAPSELINQALRDLGQLALQQAKGSGSAGRGSLASSQGSAGPSSPGRAGSKLAAEVALLPERPPARQGSGLIENDSFEVRGSAGG